jgi:hypothetical protein
LEKLAEQVLPRSERDRGEREEVGSRREKLPKQCVYIFINDYKLINKLIKWTNL